MFEDTLLIIKSDYMHKRKSVLLKLLQKDFQIQGHRKVLFSPEHAAEFYKDLTEDKSFMLQVILLSKGNAEAFILTKENAVEDLVNTMVCYFLTSMEMERNVHASKSPESVRREISFIFPNYIHEPIPYFEQPKFCQNPLMAPLIDELYDIIQGGGSGPSADLPQQNWRIKLAEWLTMSNKALPHVSNQCSRKPTIGHEEKGQQAGSGLKRPALVCADDAGAGAGSSRSPTLSLSSAGSSAMITSSSCITCSCFDGRSGEVCLHPPPHDPCDMIRRRTQTLPPESGAEEPTRPESPKAEEKEQRTDKESMEEEFEWQQPPCESELDEEFGPPEPSDVPSHESPPTVAIVVEDVGGGEPPPEEVAPPEQPPEPTVEEPPQEETTTVPEPPPEEPPKVEPEPPPPEPAAEEPPQPEIETGVGPAEAMEKPDDAEAPAAEDPPPPAE